MGGAWCYGVGGCTTVASGTHVVRKPDAPPHPMQLAPPGMTSKCSVATVFQPPGLRHAPLPSPWIHPTLNQAYSPATKCCSVGGCSAGLTHQMRKPHPAPRKLRPVPPAEAHREIATVFYAPELRHARRSTPWIHPDSTAWPTWPTRSFVSKNPNATLRHPPSQCRFAPSPSVAPADESLLYA